LSAPIIANYDVSSLRKGVGRYSRDCDAGDPRTVGLAGHRDSFFWPLRRLAAKEVRLIDKTNPYHYVVDATEIVNPNKVEVLNIAARLELALTSCFTFDYSAQRWNVLLLTLLVVGFLGRGFCHP
jgi:sortase A